MVGVRVGALQAMQEEKVTKKRGITEEDKEEFSHMTETDGLGRYGQIVQHSAFGCLPSSLLRSASIRENQYLQSRQSPKTLSLSRHCVFLTNGSLLFQQSASTQSISK